MKNTTIPHRPFSTLLALALALAAITPGLVQAAGKNSGGIKAAPQAKSIEARVTGYVTAIDYSNATIQIGASYYGSGLLKVTPDTKISLNNVNCTFYDLAVGTWVEARYDFATKVATKLSATR